MTKQEEIREGIAETLYRFEYDGWERLDAGGRVRWLVRADAVMNKEDSQGVVIKIERELPNVTTTNSPHRLTEAFQHGVRDYKEAVKNAGFEAVESLREK